MEKPQISPIFRARRQADPIERSADIQAGRLKTIMAAGREGHFESTFHMGEIDAAEVAFDDFHGPADRPSSQRGVHRRVRKTDRTKDSGFGVRVRGAAVRTANRLPRRGRPSRDSIARRLIAG